MNDRTKVRICRWALLIGALSLWEAGGRADIIDPFFFPFPSAILIQIATWARTPRIYNDLLITLSETAIGFTAGTALGVILGLWLGLSPFAAQVLEPFIKAFNAIPRIVLAPIFALWFGLGLGSLHVGEPDAHTFNIGRGQSHVRLPSLDDRGDVRHVDEFLQQRGLPKIRDLHMQHQLGLGGHPAQTQRSFGGGDGRCRRGHRSGRDNRRSDNRDFGHGRSGQWLVSPAENAGEKQPGTDQHDRRDGTPGDQRSVAATAARGLPFLATLLAGRGGTLASTTRLGRRVVVLQIRHVVILGHRGDEDVRTLGTLDLLAELAVIGKIQFRQTTRTLNGDATCHENLLRSNRACGCEPRKCIGR